MSLGLLTLGVGFGGAGPAITTPVSQGGNAQFNAGATMSITTAADIAAGDTMIIGTYSNATTGVISSISDPATSTWTAAISVTASGPVRQIYYAKAAGAIPAASTVTITFANAANRYGARMMSVSNLVPSVDVTPAGTNSTATSAISIASGVLAQPSELLVGLLVSAANPGTFTPAGSWSLSGSQTATAFVYLCYQAVSSTASVDWAPTWVNPIAYGSAMCSFKGL